MSEDDAEKEGELKAPLGLATEAAEGTEDEDGEVNSVEAAAESERERLGGAEEEGD